MRKHSARLATAVLAFGGGLFVALTTLSLNSQAQPGSGFAAVPGEKGGWDITGPYEVVRDWPKPLSQLAGHDQWTCMHGASVDPDGNLCICEVGNGRVQKFAPRRGARPELMVGKPPVARS